MKLYDMTISDLSAAIQVTAQQLTKEFEANGKSLWQCKLHARKRQLMAERQRKIDSIEFTEEHMPEES